MFASYGSEQRKISSESRSLVPQAEKDSLWQFKHSAVTRAEAFLKMTEEEFIAEMRRYSLSNNKLRPDITLFLSQTVGLSYVDEVKDENGTIQKVFQRFIQNPMLRNEYAQIILDREATYISVIHPAVRQAVFAYGYQCSYSLLLLEGEEFVREMSAKFPDCESLNIFLANIALGSNTIANDYNQWLLSKVFYFPTLLPRYLPDLDRLFPKEKRAHPVNFMRTKVHEPYDPEYLREEEIHERIVHVREKYRGISTEIQPQAFIWVAHKAGRGSIYIFNTCHRLSINFEEVFGPHLMSVLSKVTSVCGELLSLHATMPDAIIVDKARKLGKKIFALENEKMRECAAKFAKEEPIKPTYLNSSVKEVEDWTSRYLANANSALEQPAVDHASQVQRKNLEQINVRTLLWTTLLLAKSEALESILAAVGHNHGGLLLNVLIAEGYTVAPVLKAPLDLTKKEEKKEEEESEDDIEPSQIKKQKVFGKFGDASKGPDISKEPINRNHLFAKENAIVEDARGINIASVNKQDKLHPRSP